MFRRILIANRGEIAVRVARTCRRLGVEVVAVHSAADAGALHVRVADLAVPLNAEGPAGGYLDGAQIIAAAKAAGAEAIHPGYGFLSENAGFVAEVEAAGLTFIGPSSAAIAAMGLKDAAKARMAEAGVPVVPGYAGEDQSDARLAAEAEAIGYPVMIKAVAGGGGKGMRAVTDPAGFAEALASARAEARAAFGNDAVLIEKLIRNPRHVEVQVMGDGVRAVHLYERDCSLQRRHQKVIEEAPAPGMTPEVRSAMGAAAVRAAEAIGYAGAGTVEFIVDGSGPLRPDGFWFMEMNTRLQVEHPVTEAVTGLDLVEWQLRIAAGEGLPLAQEDIPLRGHAVEARIYAEDPATGFLPATGRLTEVAWPEGVRVDSGVEAGDAILPHYDPMIAKLIVHGPDRDTALAGLARALREARVAGCRTNLGFLARLAEDPDVRAGRVETGLIGARGAGLAEDPPADPRALAAAALACLPADQPHRGFALWEPLSWQLTLQERGTAHRVRLSVGGDRAEVTGDGWLVEAVEQAGRWWDGQGALPPVHRHGPALTVYDGAPRLLELPDPLAAAAGGATGEGVVRAPMPGLVRVLDVAEGAPVAAGDRLAVLEAMKMEHALRAPIAGIVRDCAAREGGQVEAGAVLFRIEPEGDEGEGGS